MGLLLSAPANVIPDGSAITWFVTTTATLTGQRGSEQPHGIFIGRSESALRPRNSVCGGGGGGGGRRTFVGNLDEPRHDSAHLLLAL